jgi:hypothetical protein
MFILHLRFIQKGSLKITMSASSLFFFSFLWAWAFKRIIIIVKVLIILYKTESFFYQKALSYLSWLMDSKKNQLNFISSNFFSIFIFMAKSYEFVLRNKLWKLVISYFFILQFFFSFLRYWKFALQPLNVNTSKFWNYLLYINLKLHSNQPRYFFLSVQ